MSDTTPTYRQQPIVVQPGQSESTNDAPETLYCANHPTVETLLRCNRCGKPICLKCAQLTDVGYRCKECIRGVQAAYFNAAPTDSVILFGTALIVSVIATPIAGFIFRLIPNFFFLSFIIAFTLGGAAGGMMVQILRTVVGKRRSRHMNLVAAGGILLGVAISGLVLLTVAPALVVNIPLLIFTFLVIATTYQLLR